MVRRESAGGLKEERGIDYWVWSVGAVAGGDERWRGAGAPVEFQRALPNPMLRFDRELMTRRRQIEEGLRSLLGDVPKPVTVPAVMVDCCRCGVVHYIDRCRGGDVNGR
jgi:hypothetical protein